MKLSLLQTLTIIAAALIGTAQAEDPCNYAGRVAFVVDGYNHKYGRDVLDVLESKKVKATVMLPLELLSGKAINKAIKSIDDRGHSIGYKVRGSTGSDKVNTDTFRGELEEAKKAFKEATGDDLVLVLCPFSDKKEVVAQYDSVVKAAGLVSVKYNFDASPVDDVDIYDQLKEKVSNPAENSYVVLANGTNKHQYDNVRTVLGYLRSHRFRPLGLEQCLSGDAGKLKQEHCDDDLGRSRRKQRREIRTKPDETDDAVDERKERGRFLVPSQFVQVGGDESDEDNGRRRRLRGHRRGRRGDRREDSSRRRRHDRRRDRRRRRSDEEDREDASDDKETNGVPARFVDDGKETRRRHRGDGKKPSRSDKPAVAEKPADAKPEDKPVADKPAGEKANMKKAGEKANQTVADTAKDAAAKKDGKDVAKDGKDAAKDGATPKDAKDKDNQKVTAQDTDDTSAASSRSLLTSGAITVAIVAVLSFL
jgi:peptidoglycan/xylan/chitin deacetylase (PgdA/CDA1 family)